jgi:hypothetical protein
MNARNTLGAAALILLFARLMAGVAAKEPQPSPVEVRVLPDEANRSVRVLIGGQPFTEYIYRETIKKPVLYPLRTAGGKLVTRGFPLEPRPGERVDHPHHVGLWFNYGDVNGLDFWNNSEAIPPERRSEMGTIRHRKIVAAKGGTEKGELEVEMDWLNPEGQTILREHTRFVFRGGAGWRGIDRLTTLRALGAEVRFRDNKEGLIGLRVTRALEAPSNKAEIFTDANGQPTRVPRMDSTGVNGVYLTSEDKEGDAAWGTRGRWCVLSGHVEGEPVSVAIFDHPANPGFPTYWHARGYGLFAANSLGQKVFSEGKEELDFSLRPGASVTFRHRVLISSQILTRKRTESAYQEFASAY